MVDFDFFKAQPASSPGQYSEIARILRSENAGLARGMQFGGQMLGRAGIQRDRIDAARELLEMRLRDDAAQEAANTEWQKAAAESLAPYGIQVTPGQPTSSFNNIVDAQVRLKAMGAAQGRATDRLQGRTTRLDELDQAAGQLADQDLRQQAKAAIASLRQNAGLATDSQFAQGAAQVGNLIQGVTFYSDGSIDYEKREVVPPSEGAPQAASGVIRPIMETPPAPQASAPAAAPEAAKPKAESGSPASGKAAPEEPEERQYAELDQAEQANLLGRLRLTDWSNKEALWEAFGDIDPDSVPPEVIDQLVKELQTAQKARRARAKGRESLNDAMGEAAWGGP